MRNRRLRHLRPLLGEQETEVTTYEATYKYQFRSLPRCECSGLFGQCVTVIVSPLFCFASRNSS